MAQRYLPPPNFHFEVEVDGITEISFMEVSGLSMETALEELVEGGENQFSHRLPGRNKFGNLVLKRGMVGPDSDLLDWVEDALLEHSYEPKLVTVSLMGFSKPDDEGNPAEIIRQWIFEKAFPVKWVTSDFKSTDNAIVIETFELAYQSFKRNST